MNRTFGKIRKMSDDSIAIVFNLVNARLLNGNLPLPPSHMQRDAVIVLLKAGKIA